MKPKLKVVMKPKLKVVIKTKTSSCEVDLVPNRANTAFLWVVAGGLGNEDTAEKLAAIGERPRAGDVASMHMAYRAGMESAPNWTTDRPTEPGEYWVSIEPGKRKGRIAFPGVIPCEVSLCANAYLMDIGSLDIGSEENGFTLAARYITGGAWVPLSDEWYDGAKWSRRETPADPFQEVVT